MGSGSNGAPLDWGILGPSNTKASEHQAALSSSTPTAHGQAHPRFEALELSGGGDVHVVLGVVADVRCPTRQDAQIAGDHPSGRIPHVPGHPARAPIGDDGRDVFQMGERGLDIRRVTDVKRHTGHQNPIKKTFEHGGQPKAPGGETKHQRLGPEQSVDVRLHRQAVGGDFVVIQPLLSGEHWVEILAIQVQVIDLVTGQAQARQDLLVQGRLVTALNGVAKNNEDAHGGGAGVGLRPG